VPNDPKHVAKVQITPAHIAIQAELLAVEVRDAHHLEQRDLIELQSMVTNCLLFLMSDQPRRTT
jgi:hypothetical protein